MQALSSADEAFLKPNLPFSEHSENSVLRSAMSTQLCKHTARSQERSSNARPNSTKKSSKPEPTKNCFESLACHLLLKYHADCGSPLFQSVLLHRQHTTLSRIEHWDTQSLEVMVYQSLVKHTPLGNLDFQCAAWKLFFDEHRQRTRTAFAKSFSKDWHIFP